MVLTPDDGLMARTPEEAQDLQGAGYQACYGTVKQDAHGGRRNVFPCEYHISPEAQAYIQDKGGYYTCPRCKTSHDLLSDLPWHGAPEEDFNQEPFSAGGGTRIGLSLKEQAQIGEDLVERMGELPGYGKITWVHPGGAISKSPLDMATNEWGIEVKTLGYDAIHHRFIPGRPQEKADKNAMAVAKGLKGVLGVLVLLNYRTSKADIYVREFPVDIAAGTGVGAFRSHNAQHLVAEVPFNNPFMQPEHPAPHGPNSQPAEEAIPF